MEFKSFFLMFESIPFFFQSEDEISAGKGNDETDQQTPDGQFETITEEDLLDTPKEESFDGMIMSANVARNSPDYVRFMAVYQVRNWLDYSLLVLIYLIYYYLLFLIGFW